MKILTECALGRQKNCEKYHSPDRKPS